MDDPFSYRITAAGQVLISRGGRMVITVAGPRAAKLIADLAGRPDEEQLLLARVTGNYRRGNERRAKR